MAVASYRPDFYLGVAFNAPANDPTVTPVWTDLSSVFRSAQQVTRGRQYELDQNQAAQPTLSFLDQNEWLNPANPASPYAPNVVPYRPFIWLAMWPNPGVGNLLNSGYGTNPLLGVTNGYDPTFESYAVNSTPPWILTFNALPVISTSTPFQGTQSLLCTIRGTGSEQAVGWTVPCMPGRTYTSSAWIRQTGANTTQIICNGNASGSSTTVTNSYVRLTVTFTATQPTHQIYVLSFTPTANSGLNIDAIQHEEGVTASTFTTSGPVIYGVFRGYIERWPSRWDYMGFLGEADLVAVDSYAPLNQINIGPEYQTALKATQPDFWWPLNEPQNAETFGEASGLGNGPTLIRADAVPYGPAQKFQAGTQMNIPGDPGGTGLEISGDNSNVEKPASIIQHGYANTPPFAGWPNATSLPASFSSAFWLSHSPADFGSRVIDISGFTGSGGGVEIAWFVNHGPGGDLGFSFTIETENPPAIYGTGAGSPDVWADNQPHLFVAVATVTANTATVTMYVDGAQVAAATGSMTGAPLPPYLLNQIQVGAEFGPGFPLSNLPDAIYAHIALWNRALTVDEITSLWNAGQGYAGETSGQRVARYLSMGGWNGLEQIDTGESVMGVSNLAADTALLQACQDVTTTENGDFYVDRLGEVTFAGRTRRYFETTSMFTFGERTDLGEFPYLGDIAFDFDPTLVYNVVEVDNYQGVNVVAASPASQTSYFPRSYQRQVNLLDNNEAVDAANYLLGQHKDPHLRVNTITLDPMGTPALWPVVLSLEIGQRVTVKRRSSAANNGAGLTISADFFVEQISHSQVNMGSDQQAPQWTTTLYLSPVDVYQVGILDDTTYGRLGSAGAHLLAAITATATTATVVSTGGDDYTTTGTPFQATVDNEILSVTSVASIASDTFARTVSSSWGTAPTGQVWTTSGGSASDYSVASGVARQSNGTVNVLRTSVLDIGSTDFDYTIDFQLSINNPTGAGASTWITGRLSDLSNHYIARFDLATSGNATLTLVKRVAGTLTTLSSSVQIGINTSSTVWRARFQGFGSNFAAKMWVPATSFEPLWQVTATDTSLTTGTQVGPLSRLETGNTNTLPVTWSYQNFNVLSPQKFTFVRPTDGTAAAHTAGVSVQTSQPFVLAY